MDDSTLPVLLADQQQRWRRGDRVRVETYLERQPALRDSRDDFLDLIYHEVVLRESLGETPTLDEYQRRFPDLSDDLRTQFEVHAGLGGHDRGRKKKRRASERLPSIPGCAVLKKLGSGGMGVVYKARQDVLGREVAVKVIRDWTTADPDELRRFRKEAEAVARVNHPNVVQVYEVGERAGCPYLVLEYVEGGSLDRLTHGQPLRPRAAAELVAVLARATDHLHRQGIVHCDLKPANVLLARTDPPAGVDLGPAPDAAARYVPKIADFGLRRLDAEAASRSGRALGTPQYMAPEQMAGPSHSIGPAADVHALGAILYELLVGRPPYLGADLLDVLKQVQFHDPVPPRRLQPKLSRDLETVCLKCLHKDPARRYTSAAQLAEDLDRFLAGKPVLARPVGPTEWAWRWCHRNPWVSGLAAALVVAIAGGFTAVTAKMLEARQERNDKEIARQAEKDRADELATTLHHLEAVTHRMRIVAADRERRDMNVAGANRILDECRPELRSFDWYHLKRLCQGSRLTVRTGQRFADRVAISRDGRLLAVAGSVVVAERKYALDLEQTVCIVDARTGTILRKLPGGKGGVHSPAGLAFSPDGKRLAVAQADAMVRVWNTETGESVWSVKSLRTVFDLVFLTGDELLTAGERWIDPTAPAEPFRIVAEFQVWDTATGRPIRTITGPPHSAANLGVLSRDGRRFAWWSSYAHDLNSAPAVPVLVCDTTTGKPVCSLAEHTSQVQTTALSPDGSLVAVADRHTIRVWSPADGRQRATLQVPSGTVHTLSFGPDEYTLAVAGEDRAVRLWDVHTGQELGIFRGHSDAITAVRFLPDGQGLVSSGHDGTVRVWDPAPPGFAAHREWPGRVFSVAADRGGNLVAVAQPEPGKIRLIDPSGAKPTRTIDGKAVTLALCPDGTTLAGDTGVYLPFLKEGKCGTRLWDTATGRERLFIPGVVGPLAFTNDGRSLVGVRARIVVKSPLDPDGDIERMDLVVCEAETGAERFALAGHSRPIKALNLRPDDSQLVTADGAEVIVWNLDSRTIRSRFAVAHRWDLGALALRPDGAQIATAGSIDRTVVVRDPATGKERFVLDLNANATALAFSPDSRLLVAGCDDGTVRIWDAAVGQLLLTLTDVRHPLRSLTFSGDGRWLVAGGGGGPAGLVTIWDGRR